MTLTSGERCEISERRTPRPVPCFSCKSSTRTSQCSAFTRVTAASSVSASPTISMRPGSTSDSNSRSRISGESSINNTRRGIKLFTYVRDPLHCTDFYACRRSEGTRVKCGLLSVLVLHWSPSAPFALFDEPVLDRVVRQVGVRLHSQLSQDSRAISAGGLH